MSSNMAIEDALIRHQVYLIRAAGSTSNKAKKLVNQLYKYVDKQLALAKTDLQVNQLTTLRRELISFNRRLDIADIVTQDLRELTSNEVQNLESLLTKTTSADIIFTSPEVLFNTINENNMVLTSTTGAKQVLTVGEAVTSFSTKAPRQISNILNFGIATGSSIQEMRYSIKKLSEKSNREIDTLTRTVTNHVMSEARSQVAKANEKYLEGEEYVATLDSRTTILCGALDGSIYPVGSGPQPPMHWNCRSIRSPKIKDDFGLDSLKGDRGFVTLDKDGNSVRGIVSGETKYSNWLKRHPKDFVDEVLGVQKSDLFRNGNLSLDKFVDSNFRELTVKELIELDGKSLAGIASKSLTGIVSN